MIRKMTAFLATLLIAVFFFGCQKENDEVTIEQEVTFGISEIDPTGLKNDPWDFNCPENNIPVKAEITIDGFDTPFYPQVFYLNGKLYTQSIKLPASNDGISYTITKFLLLNDEDQIIMATPNLNSDYSEYVNNPLTFDVLVKSFEKSEINIDVLCFIPQNYSKFGFFWFEITEIIIREQNFFGDICIKNPDEYIGSYYANQSTGLQIDMPAIFEIKAYRKVSNDVWSEIPNSPFTNANLASNWGVGSPVSIKYPDYKNQIDDFKFELWIYVAVGNGFDFVKFHTWEFNDNFNHSGVFDFVLGNCNYSETDLQLPAYINIPSQAYINITQDFNYLYWKMVVNSVVPNLVGYEVLNSNTIWSSFCGDGNVGINPTTHNFNIYNSLSYNNWQIFAYDSAELKFDRIHWLMNNIGQFSGFEPLSGLYLNNTSFTIEQAKIVQDAIWKITRPNETPMNGWAMEALHQTSQDMYESAIENGDGFEPLPGQWSSVILLKNDNPSAHQILFMVVDP